MSVKLGDVFIPVQPDMDGFESATVKGATSAGTKASQGFGGTFKKGLTEGAFGTFAKGGLGLGAGLMAAGALKAGFDAVTDAIGGSIDAAADLEDQMAIINTVAHLGVDETAALKAEVQDLALEMGKPTDELTAGLYDLVSAGVPVERAMGVLRDSAILATGALSTTGEAVDLLTSTLNAWKLDASESTRVMDVWAQTVAAGKITASQLASSIAQIAPIAAATGVSIEEVGAAYATMTAQGTPASQAATQLAAAITALLKPNLQLLELQKSLGGATFEQMLREQGLAATLQAVTDAAGGQTAAITMALGSTEAYNALLQVTGSNAAVFQGNLEGMRSAAKEGGVAVGQLAERTDTYRFKQDRLNEAVQVLQQRIGDLMIGPAGDMVEWLTDIITQGGEAGGIVDYISQAIEDMAETMDSGVRRRNAIRDMVTDAVDAQTAVKLTAGELRTLIKAAQDADTAWAGTGMDEAIRDATILQMVIDGLAAELDKMGETGQTSLALLGGVIAQTTADATHHIEEVGAAADTTGKQLRQLSDEELANAADTAEAFAGSLELVKNKEGEVIGVTTGMGQSFRDARREMLEMLDGPDLVRKQIKALQDQLGFWERVAKKAFESGRMDVWAMATANADATRSQLGDYRDLRDAYRLDRAALEAAQEAKAAKRKQERQDIRTLQTTLTVSEAEAHRIYERHAGDMDDILAKGKALARVDPVVDIKVNAHDEPLDTLLDKLRLLPSGVIPVSIFTDVDSSGGKGGKKPKIRAAGGYVSAGDVTFSGEEGPELRAEPTSALYYPADVTRQFQEMLAGWQALAGRPTSAFMTMPMESAGAYAGGASGASARQGDQTITHRIELAPGTGRELRDAGVDEATVLDVLTRVLRGDTQPRYSWGEG